MVVQRIVSRLIIGAHVQANKYGDYSLDVLAVLDIRIIAIPVHFEYKDSMDLEDMINRCPGSCPPPGPFSPSFPFPLLLLLALCCVLRRDDKEEQDQDNSDNEGSIGSIVRRCLVNATCWVTTFEDEYCSQPGEPSQSPLPSSFFTPPSP